MVAHQTALDISGLGLTTHPSSIWSTDALRSRDDIRTMKADGSDLVPLHGTPGGTDRDPSWSPTGELIAFWSTTPTGNQVFTVNAADGTGLAQVTHLDLAVDPEWSEGGSKLVFSGLSVNNSQSLDIFITCADGIVVTNLTHAAGADKFPAVHP